MSERIVVVGFGPVAARLVDELLPAVRGGLVQLLVVGQESEAAYNRVMVAERTLPIWRRTASKSGWVSPSNASTAHASSLSFRTGPRLATTVWCSPRVRDPSFRTSRVSTPILHTLSSLQG